MMPTFRVIVIGGGPVGLTAAHALHHAGIDFVVLEARDSVVLDQGASLVLAPHSLRVLHQFGLSKRLSEIGGEMTHLTSFTRDGYQFAESTTLPRIFRKNHGTAPVYFHRAQLVETIYDGLPPAAKSRYLLGKKLGSIETHDHGVRVTCTDGSTYEGSMVLGADGVHSKTRTLMRDLALAEGSPPQPQWDDAVPFTAQYRCFWCSFPRPSAADVEVGHGSDTQSKDMSVMFLAGQERGWVFLYERIPTGPTTERMRYTKADMEAYAARFADFPVSKMLKVKDVYATRLTEGMANLEEGILAQWSWGGRIVLAGDACHKFTPNAGRGLNNGMQDVVALCNGLHALLQSSGPDVAPSKTALAKVFEEYQKVRAAPLKADADQSLSQSRMHAWASPFYQFMARYVMSRDWVMWFLLNFLGAREIRKALALDYIPADEPYPDALLRHEVSHQVDITTQAEELPQKGAARVGRDL
ncbi:FAD binding domain-containing protein [Aspergillus japonicus CBS 114.51]|uniref:FAD binding domain-containing protein n=1 Tax=Aspergillus japonicus CBS 114.51 TaxID=1448312 RepID=A0A8T8WLM8_ASPJA|nr:FAD binding domain-containing protein [Aspergillus japonicus CBS 114.51]RAH76613.1 FAD binding domain-containing protein [Aspergillus japonicus CBS 114.51]